MSESVVQRQSVSLSPVPVACATPQRSAAGCHTARRCITSKGQNIVPPRPECPQKAQPDQPGIIWRAMSEPNLEDHLGHCPLGDAF